MSYAVRDFFLNGGAQAVIVRLTRNADPARVALPGNPLNLDAASPGAWGNGLSVSIDHDTRDPADTDLFNLTAVDSEGRREVHRNVSVNPGDPRFVARVLEQSSDLVRVETDGSGNPVVPGDHPNAGTVNATAGSGTHGETLTDAEFTEGAGLETNKQGLYALEKADLFNLLCIPPYRDDSDIDAAILGAVAAYCERRRALLLVDPPTGWGSKDAARGDGSTTGVAVLGTNSKNAAVFFPRLRKPNPLRDNQQEDFAPCGAVAGVMARTDATRGVWKAPAGLEATLVGVPQLSVSLTDAENGELNPLGINCLRTMPAVGRVVWGARTLQGNDRLGSEWKYIPVRRLALFLEESLYRGTHWAVFEPNDERLWSQLRLNIGAFMQNLFRQGAFQGLSPREAYFVKCDRETTTQNDINLGIVNIVVGFAPLKPAEFVVIKIQQMAGQIET
jgi:phage tail sheath protein FI